MRNPPASAGRAFSRAAAALMVALAAAGTPALAAADDAEPPVTVAPPADKVADAPAAAPGAALSLLRQLHERTSEMAVATMDFVGIRYRRGGASAETGFDCSGFTRHVFAMSLGMMLPRRADEQAAAPGFVAVRRDDLQPGDLVFFNTLRRSFSHVGIYIGANRFIHAPRTGASIRTEDMSFAYWAKRYNGARRLATAAAAAAMAGEPAVPQGTTADGE
jgi:cell wall-associated NlpC family hydrolase